MKQSIQHHRPVGRVREVRAIRLPLLARVAAAVRRFAPLAGALILAAVWASPSQASQLIPQNLKQMIQAADVIVTGEVVRISDGMEGGLPFTEVTMKVNSSVKREMAENSRYTFRQYGLLKPRKLQDGRYLLPSKIEGMATWTVGEKVTTFMNKSASRTGMTTPVGMAQGKFTYSGTQAANSFDNRNLFHGMSVAPGVLSAKEAAMLAKPAGSVEGEVLMNFVKRAVKEQWIEKGLMR